METRTPTVHEELIPHQLFPRRDETLPHQIVLLRSGVSCNCRRVDNGHGQTYECFAELADTPTVLAAYYNPSNHVGLRRAA
jgi:hypothetical protein